MKSKNKTEGQFLIKQNATTYLSTSCPRSSASSRVANALCIGAIQGSKSERTNHMRLGKIEIKIIRTETKFQKNKNFISNPSLLHFLTLALHFFNDL